MGFIRFIKEEFGLFGLALLLFLFSLLILCVFGIVASIKSSGEKHDFIKNNQCQLMGSEKAGRKVYCGKACFRDEMKEIYSCQNGEHVFYK